ncbi:M23 family metallopeptidase [Niallia sp. MER 6]|uniref:M23 family metallopeptidase n=1 Tax=Niallia sp. MER 6 TaxID=2939567 RepID=UPI00203D5896|nr:M23 family metallopeptidase [Niallia sp. MER 6]MCM3031851.1 M23 family metallopeptidase [Niallia sp. MER 6]
MREEENKRTSPKSKVKSFFKKRWAFPAVYIASAAIILTGVLWYQNSASDTDKFNYDASKNPNTQLNGDEPSVPVTNDVENFAWPVNDPDAVITQKGFYDNSQSKEEQINSLVFYDNMYQPNTGVDLKMEDNSEFEVLASLSGTVTKVSEDSVLGNSIEIEHADGIKTFYQSVKDIQVKEGDEVKKGQPLATSGQSLYNKDGGIHVHFEIRKDNVAVNPIDYFNKSLASLENADTSEASSTSEENEVTDESNKEESVSEDATENQSNKEVTEESTDSKNTDADATNESTDSSSDDAADESTSADPNA